jgi:hypothetical protein
MLLNDTPGGELRSRVTKSTSQTHKSSGLVSAVDLYGEGDLARFLVEVEARCFLGFAGALVLATGSIPSQI